MVTTPSVMEGQPWATPRFTSTWTGLRFKTVATVARDLCPQRTRNCLTTNPSLLYSESPTLCVMITITGHMLGYNLNPSDMDTSGHGYGSEESVLIREVSLFQGLKSTQMWYLGERNCLEREA